MGNKKYVLQHVFVLRRDYREKSEMAEIIGVIGNNWRCHDYLEF